jgi:hypothetical protein
VVPFPTVADDDSLIAAQLTEKLTLSNVLLPVDADSVIFTVHLYSREAGNLRPNPQLPLRVAFTLSPAVAGAPPITISLGSIPASGESRQTVRVAFPVQVFRTQVINLQPVLTNLNVVNSRGALVHVYEVVETSAGKSLYPPAVTAIDNEYGSRLLVHPNPFLSEAKSRSAGNPSTQIRFALKDNGIATLRIYNLYGQLVRALLHEFRAAGEYTMPWDGRDDRGAVVASGVYFIRFETAREVKLCKVMLVR